MDKGQKYENNDPVVSNSFVKIFMLFVEQKNEKKIL